MSRRACEPWDHNSHYHAFLLAHVPPQCGAALDVGCGTGAFARRLAAVCGAVDAIDADPRAIDHARRAHAACANLRFHCRRFEEGALPAGGYDFVSAIASLHHMDMAPALREMARLLKPGGVLAILGLYREATIGDALRSALAVPVNHLYRLVRRGAGAAADMVTRQPQLALGEIRETLDRTLAGHRFRRHLFWRYSVVWIKPEDLVC